MASPTKRESTLVRRGQIIEIVRSLLLDRGIEGVTIDAIAERIGLTEGAIYRHFASKQEILLLLVEDIHDSLMRAVRDSFAEAAPAIVDLERALRAHLQYTETRRGVSLILIGEAIGFGDPQIREQVSLVLADYRSLLKGILARGVSDGSLRPDLDLDAAVTAFFGLVQGATSMWALEVYRGAPAAQAGQLWDLFRRTVENRTHVS